MRAEYSEGQRPILLGDADWFRPWFDSASPACSHPFFWEFMRNIGCRFSFQQNATSWRKYLSPPHLCPRTLRPTGRHSQHLSKGDKLAGPYIWHVKDPRLVYSLVPRVLTECVYLRTSGFACVLCSRCHPTNSDQTLDNSQGPWAQSMLQLNRDAPRWDFRHEQQALDTSERVTVKIVKIAVDLAVGEVCLHSLDSIP